LIHHNAANFSAPDFVITGEVIGWERAEW
jgi:hypothetical protein